MNIIYLDIKLEMFTCMNAHCRFTLSFILCILFVICFGILSVLMHHQILTQFDYALISFIQGFESSLVTSVMNTFTFIGSTPSVVTLSLLSLFFLYKVLHYIIEKSLFYLSPSLEDMSY